MTKCLWVDPVYENLDDISKMMLPYLTSSSTQELADFVSNIEVTESDIIESLSTSGSITSSLIDVGNIALRKLPTDEGEQYHKRSISHIHLESVDRPELITLDLVNKRLDVPSIKFKVELRDVQKQIEAAKCDIFTINKPRFDNHIGREQEARIRSRLKKVLSMFSNDKTRLIDLDKVADHVCRVISRWFLDIDVRSIEFVWRFEREVIKALQGDHTALTWLKVFKARCIDKEPIYSMELR